MTDFDALSAPIRRLYGLLCERLEPDALTWLDACIAELSTTQHPLAPLALYHAAAARRLDTVPLGPAAESINTHCGPVDATHWTRADAGRAALVAAATGHDGANGLDILLPLFREGTQGEQTSLMRILCLLPQGGVLLPLAREASRVNSLQIYGALALDNPYPAAWYDDHDFNRMVLKCLFNGLPLGRIIGLQRRANATLSELCEDYREERVLAGRRVPADIWLALVPKAGPRGIDLALAQLASEDADHRFYATRALAARSVEPGIRRALVDRLDRETDPRITDLLSKV